MWILLLLSPLLLLKSSSGYDRLDSFTDSLLREVLSRMGGSPADHLDYESRMQDPEPMDSFPSKAFEARREPSIRDQEYLEHSSLFGNQYPGDSLHRQKPDGNMINLAKTDLPGYCIPPNPCPAGYSASDGCLENFINSAAFSREYQASQKCMCDTEHMFDCPGSTQENEIDTLANTFEKEGLADVALDRLMKTMETGNPFLDGEKLPVVAKKAPISPM